MKQKLQFFLFLIDWIYDSYIRNNTHNVFDYGGVCIYIYICICLCIY